MNVPDPVIQSFALGEYQTNCYVVAVPGAAACWIVDCGFEPRRMLDWIEARGLLPEALLLTHAHFDHIAGVDIAHSRFAGLPAFIHEAEAGYCSDPLLNLSAWTGTPVAVTEPQHLLRGGDELRLGGTVWRVVHSPGHSPGGVLFVHDGSAQAIVGDTLMAGSIGRVDFPTSDPAAFRRTIREVLMALPDRTTIHPGHGPPTTIGRERAGNPFVVHGF